MKNCGVAEGDNQLNVAFGDTKIFHFDFYIFNFLRSFFHCHILPTHHQEFLLIFKAGIFSGFIFY